MNFENSIRPVRAGMALALVLLLGGCAAEGKPGGDPGARPLPPGASCQSLKAELDAMNARGVQGKVEAVSQGRKVSDKDKTDATRYNQILNHYLGGRCHV